MDGTTRCLLPPPYALNTVIKSLPSHNFISLVGYVIAEVSASNVMFDCPELFAFVFA